MRGAFTILWAVWFGLLPASAAYGPTQYATTQPYTSIVPVDAILAGAAGSFIPLMRAVSPSVSSIGAVGGNQSGFQNVSYQRNAFYLFQHGLLTSTSTEVSNAWLAFSYGFGFQNVGGDFQCPQCQGSLTPNLSSAAFFLAYFAEIYLAMKASTFWAATNALTGNTFQTDYQALLPKLKLGVASLQSYEGTTPFNVPGGFQLNADRSAPNRLFFDGIAFQLGGQILNTTLNGGSPYCGSTLGDGTCTLTATGNAGAVTADSIQTGIVLINAGEALQQPAGAPSNKDPEGVGGYFNENGGPDTSYNTTSMLSLEELAINSLNQGYTTPPLIALAKATIWEISRVQGNGSVSWAYNTRTAPGIEFDPNGSPKALNYFEMPTSILYAGVLLNSLSLIKVGNGVGNYGVTQGCTFDPVTIVGPVTAFHVIPPLGCNRAKIVIAGEAGNGSAGTTAFGGASGGSGAAAGQQVNITTADIIITIGGGGSGIATCVLYSGSTNCASDPNRIVADFGTSASGATGGTGGLIANSFPTSTAYAGKGGRNAVSLAGGVGGSNFGFAGGNSSPSPSNPYGGGGGAGTAAGGSPTGLNGGLGAAGFSGAPGGAAGIGSASADGGAGGTIGNGSTAGGGGGGLTQAAGGGGAGGAGGPFTAIDGSANQVGGGGGGGGGSLLGTGGAGGAGGVAAAGGGGGFGGIAGGAGGQGGPGDVFIFWSHH